jgi:hypothetical protein
MIEIRVSRELAAAHPEFMAGCAEREHPVEMFGDGAACSARAEERATIGSMKKAPLRVTLTEPGLAGSYVVAERRPDGALLLEPERERLSEVIAETEDEVFRDEEFIAHLERVARSEDDLSADEPA